MFSQYDAMLEFPESLVKISKTAFRSYLEIDYSWRLQASPGELATLITISIKNSFQVLSRLGNYTVKNDLFP